MNEEIIEPMKLDFSIKVTATDFPKREISGRIVTWNEEGATSAGSTMFKPGSITFGTSTKLLLEHRRESPIGFLKSYKVNDVGIDAVFSVGNTTAGSDALVEASTGLRDGFSVGVIAEKYKNVDGVLQVSASALKEVSLVTDPAIASAKVSIAANLEDNSVPKIVEPEVTQPKPKGKKEKVETTDTAQEPAAEAVEASETISMAAAPRPLYYAKPRSPINSHATYLEHTIRASVRPNSDSALWVRAADDSMATEVGFNPTRQLTEVINGLTNYTRSNIDAISRGALPDAGMSFEIPKITAVPTVAAVAEEGAPSETATTASYITGTVQAFKGQNTLSVELIDRSSPAFFEELLRLMAGAYAKATDTAVNAAIISGATIDTTSIATYPTASELLGFVSRGAASVYANTQGFAKNIIANTSQWANLMTLNVSGAPLYNVAAGQTNTTGGVATPTSIRGIVAGLDLYVTANTASTTDTDGSMLIVNPDAYTWYESPTLRLTSNQIQTGQVEVMYYGYGSIVTKIGAGAWKFNKT
jgi:HK97 family phage prohead protease